MTGSEAYFFQQLEGPQEFVMKGVHIILQATDKLACARQHVLFFKIRVYFKVIVTERSQNGIRQRAGVQQMVYVNHSSHRLRSPDSV